VRRLLIAFAVALLWASPALAKPKVVVTPVTGDTDDKLGSVVREALDDKLTVLGPEEVERVMSKLSLSGELDESDTQRLRTKLDAAVVVQGKITRAGQKRSVKLVVSVRGKKPSDFNVQYKSAASEKFREVVREALLKRIGPVSDLEEEEKPTKKKLTDDDEEKPTKKKLTDGDEEKPTKKKLTDGDEEKPGKKKKLTDGDEEKPGKKKKLTDGDEEKPGKKKLTDGDEEKPGKKKKLADGDEEKPKKVAEGDEDKPREKPKKKVAVGDEDTKPKVRKRKRGGDGDGDGEGVQEKPAAPLPVARVDAGIAYAARYLVYSLGPDAVKPPPKLLTPAAAFRIQAEIYPMALSNRSSSLAGLGIFGEYDKAFGLSIDLPDVQDPVQIDQARYEVGALYRIAFGKASIAFGLAYERRHYIADRSNLVQKNQLDTPDVDYAAVSPRFGLRTQAASKVALFAEAGAMLVLSAGGITATENYGAGNVFGVGGGAGLDIAFTKQLGLRVMGEFNQISLSFKGTGTMASQRKVTAATDRDFGMSGTLAAWF